MASKKNTVYGAKSTKPRSSVKKSTGKKRSPRKSKKKSGGFLLPLLVAFLAGVAMAGLCYVGIETIQSKQPKPVAAVQTVAPQKAAKKQQEPVLPRIGNQTRAQTGPLEDNMQAMLDIQQALQDLQQPEYTDQISVFVERVRQVDFAIMQATLMEKLPAENVVFGERQERTGKGGPYTFQVLSILAGPQFLDTLNSCLDSWNAEAQVTQTSPGVFSLTIEGVVTHELRIFYDRGAFPFARKVTGRVEPHLRTAEETAQMVIVIDDLGASQQALQRLLNLDFPITCAFIPSLAHTRSGAAVAHKAGQEILVHMPMEPLRYPAVRPGKDPLLVNLSSDLIESRTRAAIAQVPYAVGLNNHMGSRFTQYRDKTGVVLRVLKEKRLFMLDSLTHGRSVFYDEAGRYGLQRFQRSVFLDVKANRQAILAALNKTERLALLTGQAIAIGHPLPETLAALEEWQHKRNKTVKIVRLSDL